MLLIRYLLLLTIFSWVTNGYCQSAIIDSLKQEIKDYQLSGDIDTNYSKLHFDLAWEYEQTEQIEPAIQHSQIALKSTGNNPYLQFEIHNSLGNLYMTNENYVKSIEEFQHALETATLTGDPNNVGIVHYNLSTHYYYTANDSCCSLS